MKLNVYTIQYLTSSPPSFPTTNCHNVNNNYKNECRFK